MKLYIKKGCCYQIILPLLQLGNNCRYIDIPTNSEKLKLEIDWLGVYIITHIFYFYKAALFT